MNATRGTWGTSLTWISVKCNILFFNFQNVFDIFLSKNSDVVLFSKSIPKEEDTIQPTSNVSLLCVVAWQSSKHTTLFTDVRDSGTINPTVLLLVSKHFHYPFWTFIAFFLSQKDDTQWHVRIINKVNTCIPITNTGTWR